MDEVKRFIEECNDDFKLIYRKYIWNEARFDRKLMILVGMITIVINIANIASITYNAFVSAEIIAFNILSILSYGLFLIYILIVVSLDKIHKHESKKRKCEEELEKAFNDRLTMHGINSEIQQFIVLNEIQQMKSRTFHSDGQKRIITLAANSLLIPISLTILERITEGESIARQFNIFITFMMIIVGSLIIVDIVADGIKIAVRSKYEKVEYYLKKNALKKCN